MERVIILIAALFYEVYEKDRLRWLPLGIIQFARQMRMALRPCIEAMRNVHKVLELPNLIETMNLGLLDASWICRTERHTAHNPLRVGAGDDFLYFDRFGGPRWVAASGGGWAMGATKLDVPLQWCRDTEWCAVDGYGGRGIG